MSSINFDNAYYLLIALPLIVLFTIPFALAIRKDNVNGHNITSQVLHVVIALLIGFAAAGTNYTTVLTETDVYVVADVSYSAHRNLDTIDNYIKALKLPHNAKLGLVTFGKDPELLYALGSPSRIGSVKEFTVDDSETNIAEALDYAGTLFEPDVIKRVVLITDGKQTDEQDSYAIRRAVTNLQMQNVTVDAIFVDDVLTDDTPEVQISSVDFTGSTFLNHSEYANVSIQTNRDMQARVTITSTDYEPDPKPVSLTAGVNSVSLPLPTGTAGTFDYEIVVTPVSPTNDTSEYNNTYSFTQIVSGEVNVLFVTDEWDDVQAAVNKYSEGATVEIYENDSSRDVTVSEKEQYMQTLPSNITLNIRRDVAPEIPFSVEELCRYDEIVLSDVDITGFKNYTAFVENTDIVVSMFGKSLVTMGDLHIQSKESKELKQLEDMLPVRYGNSDEDPKLFTIVIDSSRSMAGYNHLTVAKEAATRLVGLLQDTDEVCIITFNGDAYMVQMPTKLANRDAVLEKINALGVVQGTFIGAGLRMAFDSVNDLVYSDKQLMLITDGLSFTDEEDDPVTIVRDMYDNGIVTSVLDVGRPGGTSSDLNDPNASAAKALLQTLAEDGHGNYYFSNNAESLGDVVFGEMADRMTEAVIEKKTAVNIARNTDDSLDGMFEDENGDPLPAEEAKFPDVDGYIYTYSKASAISVLTVDHERGTLITPRPLYAYWNYGSGKVASFTSKFCGDWISEWEAEQLDRKFFSNIKGELTPSERMAYPFNFVVAQDGNAVHVEIVPPVAHPNATATVEITFPDGTSTRSNLTFDSSSYYTDFMTAGQGKYTIDILYRYNTKEYAATRVMTLAYPSEYDAFETFDSAILHKAIDNQGTVAENESLVIENDERLLSTYTVELTVPLLAICAGLFVVDIIIRKLKWEDIRSFFGLGKKQAAKKTEVKKP